MGHVDLTDRFRSARERVETAEAALPVTEPPMYAQLRRKDARVRDDQYAALTLLAGVLMKRRRVKVERITENTLIRVAIDLLLTQQHQLRGSTEYELRKSIGAVVPEFGTSEIRDSGSAGVGS